MSAFETGRWVRQGSNIVLLGVGRRQSPAEQAGEWLHEAEWLDEEGESGSEDVAWVQRSLNQIMGAGLAVDGIVGPLTRAAIIAFQRSEGLAADGIAGPITTAALQRRLASPSRPAPSAPATGAIGTFEGIKVATWLIPYLTWARAHGWTGRLASGWRDPAYSEQLCMKMCGAPTCPGRCAGRSSNHSGSFKPHGAIDVTDFIRFGQLMAQCPLTPHIFNDHNAIPKDPGHFSATGR